MREYLMGAALGMVPSVIWLLVVLRRERRAAKELERTLEELAAERASHQMECVHCGVPLTDGTAMRSTQQAEGGVPVQWLMCVLCFVATGGAAPTLEEG
jgi:hypothetical protein